MSSVKHQSVLLNNGGYLKGLGNLQIKSSDDTVRFIIDNTTGNVGIGTTTTSDKLHVVGDANITGSLTVNGSPMATSQWENGTGGEIYYNTANVGIGTNDPAYKLEVAGNTVLNNAFIGDIGLGAGLAGFKHKDITSNTEYGLLQANSGALFLNASPTENINFRIDNVQKMIMDSNGNLGIGTGTPDSKLHVVGDLKVLGITDLQTSGGTTSLYISSSGEVGVGTASSPGSKLNVEGNVRIEQALNILGTTDASSTASGGAATIAGGLAVAKKSFFGGDMDLGNSNIKNLADPSAPADAANKAYVDTVARGLSPKQSVRVATTTAGTLALSFEDGDTVDGVTLATNDRILIKNQSTQSQNGIYIVQSSGSPIRATDFDAPEDNVAGAYVFVQEGTVNADSGWVCITNKPVTFGTSDIQFTQFTGAGSITAGDNIDVSGNQVSVVPNPSFAGDVTIQSTGNVIVESTDSSSSTSSGALVVTGGVGIGGSVNVGGNVVTNAIVTSSGSLALTPTTNITTARPFISTNATDSTSASSGALVLSGGIGINTATDATSLTDGGALTIAGGLAVAKTAYIKDIIADTSLTYTGMVISPSITRSLISNIGLSGDLTVVKSKLIKLLGDERMLCLTFSIDPTASNTTTSFEFTVPDVSSNFSSISDIVGNINGIIATDLVNIENCVIYSKSSSTNCIVSLTAGDASKVHYVNITVQYTSN